MTRKAWTWVVIGYVTLAIGFTVVSIILVHQIHKLDHTQTQLRNAGREIKHTQGLLGAFTIKITGALCLLALEQNNAAKRRLVEAYVSGAPISLERLGPTCRKAADRAIVDVFDNQPPPEVKALK